jgi:predicted enzyme related to lactoylglutathione lyase
MAIVTEHAHGAPCWFELATPDQAAAKKFYTDLFGWAVFDAPIGDDQYYSMFKIGDSDVGAAYTLPPEWGAPPHWAVYFNTHKVDETAAKVKELGGTVMKDPFDVMEHGRMAVLQDPDGAVFSAWQKKDHVGASRMNEPHTVCWVELATRDMNKAREFYTGVFGWETKESTNSPMAYTEFGAGGQHRGGILQMTDEWAGIPPHWMVYFMSPDTDAAVEKLKDLGGEVKHGPFDLPNVGRIAVVSDAQGAIFSLITLQM